MQHYIFAARKISIEQKYTLSG